MNARDCFCVKDPSGRQCRHTDAAEDGLIPGRVVGRTCKDYRALATAGGVTFSAAVMIALATSFGWLSIATWLDSILTTLALMLADIAAWKRGSIIWSSPLRTYQDGFVFHAATVMASSRQRAAQGPWVAATTFASARGKSCAKSLIMAS